MKKWHVFVENQRRRSEELEEQDKKNPICLKYVAARKALKDAVEETNRLEREVGKVMENAGVSAFGKKYHLDSHYLFMLRDGKNDEAEAYFKKEIHALSRKFQNKEDARLFEELLLQKSEDMKKQVELEQAFPKVETEYKKYKMNLDKQRESEAPKEVEEYFRARNIH